MLYYAVACALVVAGFIAGSYAGDKYVSRYQSRARCRQTAAELLVGGLICIVAHFICRYVQWELLADVALAALTFCAASIMELARGVYQKRSV